MGGLTGFSSGVTNITNPPRLHPRIEAVAAVVAVVVTPAPALALAPVVPAPVLVVEDRLAK
jgi:hypothetical protein